MNSIFLGLLSFYITKKIYTGYAKCVFSQTWVQYLSHIISGGVVVINPAKMHAFMDWPEPT